ncbi:MAG: FKBP-type peptidyl-prolyl cis-trans isomerase, partial [Prevotella sp.]|nr:FKBP-type peptidyl-prolyl cis-trans isomerase [Prevotella sp.]
GDVVEVNYRVKLTDGTVLYDLTGRNADVIEVGKERRQTGFAEGLTLLREGDRAIIVVPSILAYGALGDRDKIPPRATLVYDVIGVSKTGKNR